ncbi:Hypothetical predicted protein [Mytilus galloprovincialis]|uniref:Failed axon connections-like protein n=1 Tax=Mytilus galloprovincialis TaxID=29158 RepID=A0A8B6DCK1_MYTGA|nr:Hypothetical predicted protein [Mytilus galloprovincialis]
MAIDIMYKLPSSSGTILIPSIAIIFSFLLWKKLAKTSNSEVVHPKDTVIFHQPGRGPFAPSLSPFVVKLETYLRMAKIPYQNVHDSIRGSKGKIPWIEYNDVTIPDSQLIIEYLNKLRDVDLNRHLTEEQEAVAVAFQRMVDEHTYWLMVINRWKYDNEMREFKLSNWSWLKLTIARWFVNSQTHQQGLGRHTKDEIMAILNKDFHSLSTYLGKKKYIFGDIPSELDSSIFGQLSQFRWHLALSDITDLFQRYQNLDRYCQQMKNAFWPDWDDCVKYPVDENSGIVKNKTNGTTN